MNIKAKSGPPTRTRLKIAEKEQTDSSLPKSAHKSGVGLTIKTILLPTDFSLESEEGIRSGVALAQMFGAKIHLIHVVIPVSSPDFDHSFPLIATSEQMIADCRKAMYRLQKKLEIDKSLVAGYQVCFGSPASEISRIALRMHADLIVLSTHGFTGLKHLLIGSTAERIVRYASCPVLVVRNQKGSWLRKKSETTGSGTKAVRKSKSNQ